MVLLAFSYLPPAWGQSVVPRAGTTITNRARVTYTDPSTSLPTTLDSNEVRAVVQPQEAFTLTQDNTVSAPPGASPTLAHRLTNTGNTVTSFVLNLANLPGDDFDLANLTLFNDVNRNGQIDTGEPQVALGSRITLEADETLDLLITGTLPTAVSENQTALVRLNVATELQNITASNTDTIEVSQGVAATVRVTGSVQTAGPGEVVTFTPFASNLGLAAPNGIAATVDGAARTLIVLRNVVPANTTFVGFQNTGAGVALFHLRGTPVHVYQTTLPADLSTIDAVAYGVEELPSRSSLTFSFQVRLNPNASGEILNVATLFYTNPLTGQGQETQSNAVVVNTPKVPPTLEYFRDSSFNQTTQVTFLGRPLFVQASAGICNEDPLVAETEEITISSRLTGDVERFLAVETGPNTGIFRILPSVPTRSSDGSNLVRGNGILETVKRDTLTAVIVCSGTEVTQPILIDPFGVVFDSRTNQPVAGARVTLINVATGQPAQVFDFDGVTPALSTVTTGPDGTFTFPQVAAGVYRLEIVPPTGFTFPSTLPPSLLPPDRILDASGSYGGTFFVSEETGAVQLDIPVDAPITGLFLEKTVSRRFVELADFLDYQIRFRNTTGIPLQTLRIADALPYGFAYELGTARLVGSGGATQPLNTAQAEAGPGLSFTFGAIADGQEITLSYRVRVGPRARFGDNVNRAQATGTSASGVAVSNVASVSVKVQGGVLNDKGIIFGKVFIDTNRNRIQDVGEVGIPRVRVFLEDGTFAITDEEGKYSLYGLRSGTRVVKVDETTLPASARLHPLTNRHGREGGSSFVDLKKSEMHKVNFGEMTASPALLAEAEERRKRSAEFLAETEQSLRTPLPTEAQSQGFNLTDPRSRPAFGVVGGLGSTSDSQNIPDLNQQLPNQTGTQGLPTPLAGLPVPPIREVPALAEKIAPGSGKTFEALLPGLGNELGFVDLKDNDTLPIAQANVRVKGGLGATFTLRVNGEVIPDKIVGTKSTLEDKQIEAWEYIGVRFRSGENTLEVSQTDSFGNARGSQRIRVIAPGQLGRLKISGPAGDFPADGVTPVRLRVELTDDRGTPISARTLVTLESNRGVWQEKDINTTEPGVQTFLEGGRAEFVLTAPREPGNAAVRISSGILVQETTVSFVPELRPLLGVGVIEGRFNFFKFKPRGVRAVNSGEYFEQELKSLSRGDNGDSRIGGRAALFLKGRVQGKYLLTMRYDSQQDPEERLFRDIQPDQFYPIYGDAAVKGFDAQSTSSLYVRVDKNKSYLMHGDFTTSGDYSAQNFLGATSLGNYVRSLTGFKGHQENDRLKTNFFYSHDNSRQVVEEFPANGTSGPYRLQNTPFLENSEKVEIIVRDREQPSRILQSRPQSRFSDYMIDGLTEGILFRSPVPSRDANLNLVYIRVTYEVEQGGPRFSVFGADTQFNLSDRLQLSTALVRDRNPQAPLDLLSASASYRFSPNTLLIGEWAHTDRNDTGSGSAQRLEFSHEGARLLTRLFWGRSDESFDNPSSILNRGREEASGRLSYQFSPNSRLLGEVIRTRDVNLSGARIGGQIGVEHALNQRARVALTLRRAKETGTSPLAGANQTPIDFTSIRARLSSQLPGRPEAGVYAEYEQDIKDTSKRVLALGGEYQIANRSRLYARYELISTLSGRYALYDNQSQHTTVFGIDTDYMRNGHLFSEYRIRDAISGREAEAAIGLRNGWNLGRGLRVHTSLERVQPLSNSVAQGVGLPLNGIDGKTTAASIGVEFTRNPALKATTRLELRRGANSNSVLHTFGAAYKANDDWTALARSIINQSRGNGLGALGGLQHRLQLGIAYRQTSIDKWSGLAKYEYRADRDSRSLLSNQLRRRLHLLTADVNYQPGARLTLSGHYAAKLLADTSNGISSSTSAQLISGRATYDWSRRSDISVIGSTLIGEGFSDRQYGLGVELGYMLSRNFWLSAGYNFVGFRDPDFVEDNTRVQGSYLRFRYKFDEDLFGARSSLERRALRDGESSNVSPNTGEVATSPLVPLAEPIVPESEPTPQASVTPQALATPQVTPAPSPIVPEPAPAPIVPEPVVVESIPQASEILQESKRYDVSVDHHFAEQVRQIIAMLNSGRGLRVEIVESPQETEDTNSLSRAQRIGQTLISSGAKPGSFTIRLAQPDEIQMINGELQLRSSRKNSQFLPLQSGVWALIVDPNLTIRKGRRAPEVQKRNVPAKPTESFGKANLSSIGKQAIHLKKARVQRPLKFRSVKARSVKPSPRSRRSLALDK